MTGHVAATAPHLDGSEDIGVWFDVAWAAYMHVALTLGTAGVKQEAVDDIWEGLTEKLDDNGQPTPETWGTSESAQRGQAAMFAMFGASPDMGAAPTIGDDVSGG